LDYETIDINDERAKELAQILVNEKAIAILHLIEETPMSISEIARKLNLPISTVSYHIDKMMRVGLIEIAGKKYGKRLQEVKLYRASNRPILLVPRKSVAGVEAKTSLRFERLHVISLTIAGLLSTAMYWISAGLIGGNSGTANPTVTTLNVSSHQNTTTVTSMNAPSKMAFPPSTNTSTTSVPTGVASGSPPAQHTGFAHVPIVVAVITFIITFLAAYYLLKKRR